MSIKQRIKALERQYKINMGQEPWLTFDIDGKPTPEQHQAMDEADRQGKTYICFITQGDTIYLSCLEYPKAWLD
jgi:hypothetical protein